MIKDIAEIVDNMKKKLGGNFSTEMETNGKQIGMLETKIQNLK